MILKKLELENIRSHSRASVELPEGVVLFEGDVGCGKSSLLYAIEFALFGLGDLNAAFLLRNSASSGFVKLDFSVNGKDFQACRFLEKKKTVQQGECYVVENGVKTAYTPSEMKPAILKILGFNEPPSPRSQSIIYRYAVFTPQEEMKRILDEKPEDRLQTLRKAFGIEEYRIARDNASLLLKDLRDSIKFLEGQTADLPALEADLAKERERLGVLEKELGVASSSFSSEKVKVEKLKVEFASVQEKLAELKFLKQQIPSLEKTISDKKGALADLAEQKTFLAGELDDLKSQLEAIKPTEGLDYSSVQVKLKAKQSEISFMVGEIAALESKKKDFASLKEKGVCPTCSQKISGDFDTHYGELDSRVSEKQLVLQGWRAEESDLQALLEQAMQLKAMAERAKDLETRFQRRNSELTSTIQKISLLEPEVPKAEGELASAKERLSAVSGVEESAKALEGNLKAAEVSFNGALALKTRLETQSADCKKQVSSFEMRVAEKNASIAKLNGIRERRKWVEEHFIPSLAKIESIVLESLNREFDLMFKKWFMLLVESQDISVSVGSQFEPLVQIGEYEHPHTSLSGGEKSALALAYRLSLNAIVKSVSVSMNDNLLILDEPTDGFSKEQLARLKRVLEELDSKQVLLVSHERELEAFADKVFRIEKKGGASVIS